MECSENCGCKAKMDRSFLDIEELSEKIESHNTNVEKMISSAMKWVIGTLISVLGYFGIQLIDFLKDKFH